MKILEFIKTYYLHDSIVEKLTFCQSEQQLELAVEMCRWQQTFFQEGEPEMQLGRLIFSGVSNYKIDPDPILINSDEILVFELLPTEECEDEKCKIVLYDTINDVKILLFQAKDVQWIVP
ncbi:hypothetical protein [Brevibacillus dissolubilis]|uniref:hypothetical protein n=1 Tax=Brevibacillus dissolubilis TaxID=1844116 RepID=UPI001116FA6D|nr:hypothetical protein [Brevibacillus dissolubilis]